LNAPFAKSSAIFIANGRARIRFARVLAFPLSPHPAQAHLLNNTRKLTILFTLKNYYILLENTNETIGTYLNHHRKQKINSNK
jgi:hypothetical protein